MNGPAVLRAALRGLAFCGLGLALGFGMAQLWSSPAAPGRQPAVSAPPPPPVPAELLAHVPSDGVVLRELVVEGSSPARRLFVEDNQFVERLDAPRGRGLSGPLRFEYAMDAGLTEEILKIARHRRVVRGHIVVMDVATGRLLAYVSTDEESFPGQAPYPAASLAKIVTAASALQNAPTAARSTCWYRGHPYRLKKWHLKPVTSGNSMSLERALATSNNQCFAKLAVHELGADSLLETMRRFGWTSSPAPGHEPGTIDSGVDDYDLGQLGSGLDGTRITPLHAVQLAATLARGELVSPWWIDRVIDARGHPLAVPMPPAPATVMPLAHADELRQMLVRTTKRGTARSAFRNRRGRPRLGEVDVAGKTGNLNGSNPKGRYEWFAGVAPAEAPEIAIAVVQLHGSLWWSKSSEVAAEVLSEVFCDKRTCSADRAGRYTASLGRTVAPVFLNEGVH